MDIKKAEKIADLWVQRNDLMSLQESVHKVIIHPTDGYGRSIDMSSLEDIQSDMLRYLRNRIDEQLKEINHQIESIS